MNISTGGPRILLFERDQQLAALLTSELQLAGYECHTARTAVEVFDAIARFPLRLVLVNLAQAAASRREFWVALDSQRRGRGVQVLTFRSTNIAGYGPRELEEFAASTAADMEIDGMPGVRSLVDTVRAYLPGFNTATTLPRMPRTPPPPATAKSAAPSSFSSRNTTGPVQSANFTSNAEHSPTTVNSSALRAMPPAASPSSPPRPASSRTGSTPLPPTTPNAMRAQEQAAPATSAHASTSPTAHPGGQATGASSLSGQGEKIHAVLYPSQRTWTSASSFSEGGLHSARSAATTQPRQPGPSSPGASLLQQLASGLHDSDESSLAQLSRLAQQRYASAPTSASTVNERASGKGSAGDASYQPGEQVSSYQQAQALSTTFSPIPETPALTVDTAAIQSASPQIANGNAVPATPPQRQQELPAPPAPSAFTAQLRPSPIQDLPAPQPTANYAVQDAPTRPAPGRWQKSAAEAAPAPLPSLSAITPPSQGTADTAAPLSEPAPAQESPAPAQIPAISPLPEAATPQPAADEHTGELRTENGNRPASEHAPSEQDIEIEKELATDISPGNTMLLDILQSLPPVSALPQPPAQPDPQSPPVLSGRATRSLSNVLLAGHLVPQDRLEVAQRIQRMLRGVDLNYQLGEILLMFKLLTPDQLLAASLVSYGLINATQISSLGRIRQELHALGLEYDLENLLIMFRILTPEQLREVKSSWRG